MNNQLDVKEKKPREKLTLPVLISELKSGKSAQQIAGLYGYTRMAVYMMLKRNGLSVVNLRAYKEQKADLFAFKQSQIVEAMSPKKIKAASLRDQAVALTNLNNIERLERGQSTDNISFAAITRELSELEAEEVRIRGLMAVTSP